MCANRLEIRLFNAGDIMAAPVVTITPRETLAALSTILLETKHCGFPVIKKDEKSGLVVLYGIIVR